MRIRIARLFLFFLIFYLVWDAAGDYFRNAAFFRADSFTLKTMILTVTGFACFFLYPLSVCLILKRFVPRQTIVGFLLILFFLPFIILTRYFIQEIAGPVLWGFDNYADTYTIKMYMVDNLYFAVLFSGFGVVYFFNRYAQYAAAKQAELVMAAKDAELSFLKSQVNPHFLFNSLHNIYTLIYQKNDNALSAVEKLSSLLRYALYEQKEKVTLETEISYLRDYIQLQRLRYDASYPIQMDLDNVDGSLHISPLLLISFVENAFKHGDFSDTKMPLMITAQTMGNTLTYQVRNKKAKFNKAPEGGIGLGNVKRRLDLLYAERYTWETSSTEDQFAVILTIKL
jgi:two-component system LytT family sensor kinase